MNYITGFLSNLGLKRVCKFILKRALGQYLLNDLDMDQFEVLPKEGIRIKNIELDAQNFNNKFLNDSSVKCVSALITEIDIFISVSRIFNDSCHVIVRKLEVILAPNDIPEDINEDEKEEIEHNPLESEENKIVRDRFKEKASKLINSDSDSDEDVGEEEDNEGLDYIANWIENFILKLRGTVDFITINVLSKSYSSALKLIENKESLEKNAKNNEELRKIEEEFSLNLFENSLQLELKDINYYNMDPSLINPNPSLNTSNLNSSFIYTDDVSTRQLDIGSILFGHVGKLEYFTKIFEISDMNHLKFNSSSQFLDIILSVSTLELVLNSEKISSIFSFLDEFLLITSSYAKNKINKTIKISKQKEDLSDSHMKKSFLQKALEETSAIKSIEYLEKELKENKNIKKDLNEEKLLLILSHIKKLQSNKLKNSARLNTSSYSDSNFVSTICSSSDLKRNTQLNSSSYNHDNFLSIIKQNQDGKPNENISDSFFGEHYDTDINFGSDEEDDSFDNSQTSVYQSNVDSCLFFSTLENKNSVKNELESSFYPSTSTSESSPISISSSSQESSFKFQLILPKFLISIEHEEIVNESSDEKKILKLSLQLLNNKFVFISGNKDYMGFHINYLSNKFGTKTLDLKGYINISVDSIDLISQEYIFNSSNKQTKIMKDYKLFGFLDKPKNISDSIQKPKPGIRIDLGFLSNSSSSIYINVDCLPIILSINIGLLNKWISIIKDIFPLTQQSESSLASLSIKVNIPSIDLILQCDERYGCRASSNSIENPYTTYRNVDKTLIDFDTESTDLWNQVDEVLRLDLKPDMWKLLAKKSHSTPNLLSNVYSNDHHLVPFLTHFTAGFLIHFSSISVKFNSNLPNQSDKQIIEIQSISFSLLFYSSYLSSYFTSLIFQIKSDDKLNNLIKLEKIDQNIIESSQWGNKSAILTKNSSNLTSINGLTTSQYNMMNSSTMYTSQFPSSTNEKPTSSLGPPELNPNQLIQLSAYSIESDIQKREFSLLTLFGDCLIYKYEDDQLSNNESNNPSTSSNTNSPSSSSFGLIISTLFASISFSENEVELWEDLLENNSRDPKQDEPIYENMTYNQTIKQLTSILYRLKQKEKKIPPNSNSNIIKNKKIKVTATIRKPRFELFSSESKIFLGIKANDVSFYEMTPKEYKRLKDEKFNFHSAPKMTQGGRQGDDAYRIPFIHRAYGWKEGAAPLNSSFFQPSSSIYESKLSQSTLLGNHNDYGHAFEIKILFSTIKNDQSSLADISTPPLKSVQIFIDFYDIVLCHDPESLWIFKMINVISPKRPLDVMAKNIENFLYQISMRKELLTDKADIERLKIIKNKLYNIKTYANNRKNNIPASRSSLTSNPEVTEPLAPPVIPFETTSVIVRIRDLLIDHPSPQSSSRSILSIGTLTISTNLVSSSIKYSIKITLDKLAVYIRKQSNASLKHSDPHSSISPPNYFNFSTYPTSPLKNKSKTSNSKTSSIGWLSNYGFLPIITLDYFNSFITLNNSLNIEKKSDSSSEKTPLTTVTFNLGSCIIQGSLDTIELGIKESNIWIKDTQKMAQIIEKRDDLKTVSAYYYYYQRDENNSFILYRYSKSIFIDYEDIMTKWEEYEYQDDYFDRVRYCDVEDEEIANEDNEIIQKDRVESLSSAQNPSPIIPHELLEGNYPYLVPNNTINTSEINEDNQNVKETEFLSKSQWLSKYIVEDYFGSNTDKQSTGVSSPSLLQKADFFTSTQVNDTLLTRNKIFDSAPHYESDEEVSEMYINDNDEFIEPDYSSEYDTGVVDRLFESTIGNEGNFEREVRAWNLDLDAKNKRNLVSNDEDDDDTLSQASRYSTVSTKLKEFDKGKDYELKDFKRKDEETEQKSGRFFSISEPGLIYNNYISNEEKVVETKEEEQTAKFFVDPNSITIITNYIPVYSPSDPDEKEEENEFESKLLIKPSSNSIPTKSKFSFTLLGDFRFRIYSGKEWEEETDAIDKEKEKEEKETEIKKKEKEVKVSFSNTNSSRTNSAPSEFGSPLRSSLKQNKKNRMNSASIHSDFAYNFTPKIKRASRDSIDVFARKVSIKGSFFDEDKNDSDNEDEIQKSDTSGISSESLPSTTISDHPPISSNNVMTSYLSEKFILSVQDILVAYRHSSNMEQQKVIGSWSSFVNNNEEEYHINESKKMVNIWLAGYKQKRNEENSEENVEFRCCISLSPIRIFLNDYIINFFASYYTLEKQKQKLVREKASTQTSTVKIPSSPKSPLTTPKKSSIYFQHLYIYGLALKIDYPPDLRSPSLPSTSLPYSITSINSLAQITDTVLLYLPSVILMFLKILMPRGGVVIMLRPVKGRGLFADDALFQKIGQKYGSEALSQLRGNFLWGGHGNKKKSTPERTRSNSISGMPKPQSNSNVLKHVGAGVGAIAQGIAQGAKDSLGMTLSLSHKVSSFVAQGITDLVSDETPQQQYLRAKSLSTSSDKGTMINLPPGQIPKHQPHNIREGIPQAKDAFMHDLQEAYNSLLVLTNSAGLTSTPTPNPPNVKLSKAIPRAVLLPLAGLVRGIGVTLLALRNEIDPMGRQENKDIQSSLAIPQSLQELLEKEEALLREMEGESEDKRDFI